MRLDSSTSNATAEIQKIHQIENNLLLTSSLQEKCDKEGLVGVLINDSLENFDFDKEEEYKSSQAGGKRKRNPTVRKVVPRQRQQS